MLPELVHGNGELDVWLIVVTLELARNLKLLRGLSTHCLLVWLLLALILWQADLSVAEATDLQRLEQ